MIELVDVMGTDLSIVNAARVSFRKEKAVLEDGDIKLINYLAKHKHMTPFRHPHLSIRVTAPIFLARQLGKHQTGLTWNEVSRRYVDDAVDFFRPQTWRNRPEDSIKQGSGGKFYNQSYADQIYKKLIADCSATYYAMIKSGIAPEQARMVLPQSMLTEWIWTGSLLAFFHVWNLRHDPHAQMEAQDFANELDEVIKDLFPYSWKALKENS